MHNVLLTPRLIEYAYRQGFFPMSDPQTLEVNWYRPDPRAVLPLEGFHCSRSLKKTIRASTFVITYNRAFAQVISCCADRSEGSWISEEIMDVYTLLSRRNKAHSVEVWLDDTLVGGVYGLALGGAFFAESMFHRKTDASKVALFHLVERLNLCGYRLLEVQFVTSHLKSLGAIEIPDAEYQSRLKVALSVVPTDFAQRT